MMRTTNMARICAVATTAATGLTLSACSGGSDNASSSTAGQTVQSTSSTSTKSPSASPMSTASDTSTASGSAGNAQTRTALTVIDTATKAVSGGSVFDLEKDHDQGKQVWDVKVADGKGRQFDLDISADGSTVVHRHQDRTPDDDIAKLHTAKITVQKAIGIAAAHAQGKGDLSSLEIDTTGGGTVVWQVGFGGDDGTTVLVDAHQGTVVSMGSDAG